MTPKKLLLAIAITLSIFVLYFGYGTDPDMEVITILGWKWGANVGDYTILKLISGAAWFAYFLYPSKEDEADN